MNIKTVVIVIVLLATVARGLQLLSQQLDLSAWNEAVPDPTERGLIYLAVAIVLHAVINFLRPSFPKEIKLQD